MKNLELFKERIEFRDGDLYYKPWDGMSKRWATKHIGKPVGYSIGNHGYKIVVVSKDKKRYSMLRHRLVYALVFGPIPKGKMIDHIDRNKLNNHPMNLRWLILMLMLRTWELEKIILLVLRAFKKQGMESHTQHTYQKTVKDFLSVSLIRLKKPPMLDNKRLWNWALYCNDEFVQVHRFAISGSRARASV